jgi:tetratricopeptide (TPR) repeat protein
MEVERFARVRARRASDPRFERLRGQLSLARDLRDAELAQRIVSEAQAMRLSDEELRVLRAEAGVGLVRLGAFLEARELLKPLVAADPQARHPEAHAALAGAYYRSKDATEDDFTEAEGILVRLLAQRPQHPEAWAALGAVRKRRSLLRDDEDSRRRDLEDALAHYRRDYERDLNAFYEGINVAALGVVLWLRYHDRAALASAREALPAVAYAASLRLRKRPEDFWAAATIAESSCTPACWTVTPATTS